MVRRYDQRLGVVCDTGLVGPVQQHCAAETQIVKILERYQRTGQVPTMKLNPVFGDFGSGLSFHESVNKINEAKEEFESLPAKVKKRFKQNPSEVIDFVGDVKNREEAIELGLIENPKKIDVPVTVEVPVKNEAIAAIKSTLAP